MPKNFTENILVKVIAVISILLISSMCGDSVCAQKESTNTILTANSKLISNLNNEYIENKGFSGNGMGMVWAYKELNFDSEGYQLGNTDNAETVDIALFYITVEVKEGACPPSIAGFWNYNQMPVYLVNYATNITGCDSQGILQTTAGDVNTHFYYAIKDPGFNRNTIPAIAVFTLWPGLNISINEVQPSKMYQNTSDGNYYIKVHVEKFKEGSGSIPPGSSTDRMLVPYQS